MQDREGERRLVARMLKGDRAAFDAFFAAYFPRLFRFALHRLNGDEDRAEDVVQAALTRAMDRINTWRGEAALFTWLCTFCRHEIGALLKKEARSGTRVIEDDPSIRAALESLADAGDDPERAMRRTELARLVKVALDSLPAAYGDALEWKYIDGLTVREIGERIGRGGKATESLLTRARVAFRDGFAALTGGDFDWSERGS